MTTASNTQVQYNQAGTLSSGSNSFVFDYSTNNVGIGVTSPITALHVKGRRSSWLNMVLEDADEQGIVMITNNDMKTSYIWNESVSGSLWITTNAGGIGGNLHFCVGTDPYNCITMIVANTGAIVGNSFTVVQNIPATATPPTNVFTVDANGDVVALGNVTASHFIGNISVPTIVNKTITFPSATHDYLIAWIDTNKTISEIITITSNTAPGAWCNATFYWGTNRQSANATIFNANTANNTTGIHTTSFTNNTPTSNSFIWCTINGVSNVSEFDVIVKFS